MNIAHSNGINWVWFVEYELVGPGRVKLLRHYRIHKGDVMPSDAFEHEYHIIEKGQDKYGNLADDYEIGDPRIADKLVIDNDYDNPLKIANPKEIFTYR